MSEIPKLHKYEITLDDGRYMIVLVRDFPEKAHIGVRGTVSSSDDRLNNGALRDWLDEIQRKHYPKREKDVLMHLANTGETFIIPKHHQ